MAHKTSTSTSTQSATATGETKNSANTTIGVAVGLGVGIPVLLTVIILVWVTVRHNRKIGEEDEMDKELDFNGDVSFWSPQQARIARFDRNEDLIDPERPATASSTTREKRGSVSRHSVSRASVSASDDLDDSSSNLGAPSTSFAQSTTGSDAGSLDAARLDAARVSHMYTPEFMFRQGSHENFTRALDNVYGPSPLYPSTEKLRAPSSASLRSQPTGSVYGDYAGPFATPPRSGGGPRRFSNSSESGSLPPDPPTHSHMRTPSHPQTLGQLRESPHPYMDLAGAPDMVLDDHAVADDAEDPRQSMPPVEAHTPHVYHEQARDRTSKFSFS